MNCSTATLEDKYGRPLTGPAWPGLPLRVGEIAQTGSIHDLDTDSDAVLLWSGGASDVSIAGSRTDLAGSGEQGHRFTRHAGMIDLLPRGTSIKEIRWQGARSTCVSVNLPKNILQQLTLGSGLDARRGPRYGLVDAHVVDLVQRLRQQAATHFPLGAAYVQGLSTALAAYLAARYGERFVEAALPSGFSDAQRSQLIDYVESHLSLDVGLLDLANVVGYSPDHFSRLFKRCFGTTPYRYLLERRVERAKSLLQSPRSIASIAFECGFASQSHLNVAFKRLTGSTPGAFRKR